uniref:Uncharacterized protein n=1 Tax=Amphimedon queenslandica TaxID=400682 RepID=A0A1X7V2U9_AMPQE
MIARVVEQQQPLFAALLDVKWADLFPSDDEFITMDVYLDVTKPLVTIKEAISAQKWVTISKLRPLLHKLLKSHLIKISSDTSLAKKMKSEMNNNFRSQYTDNLLLLLSKAAFLDPRLKNHPFLSPIEVNELHDLISQEAGQIAESNHSAVDEIDIDTDSAAVMPPSTKKAKGKWELFELLSDVMHTRI